MGKGEDMKRWWYFIVAAAILMACKSVPPTEESLEEEMSDVEEMYEEEGPLVISTITVSQELYDDTLAEVRLFVENLNVMISSKNYNGWRDALSDEFFARISSPEFLARVSESPGLKSRKIVLQTPNDYFIHVVVPARSNSKVDEIEFIDTNRVKVFYIEERGRRTNSDSLTETRRLRLYDLIDIGNAWKIID